MADDRRNPLLVVSPKNLCALYCSVILLQGTTVRSLHGDNSDEILLFNSYGSVPKCRCFGLYSKVVPRILTKISFNAVLDSVFHPAKIICSRKFWFSRYDF